MDSNSLDNSLNYILNTLPRTQAPSKAIRSLGKTFFKSLKRIFKDLSNDKILEVYVVTSQKNLSFTFFDKKIDKKRNERKS